MKNIIYSLLLCSILINPASAQLARPLPGVLAPAAINYFRVALIPRQLFNTKEAAEDFATAVQSNFYKPKVITVDGGFKIALMVRIIFFKREDAEQAAQFLTDHPSNEDSKYDIQVISDSSY